jgi:hypothetical protein
MQKIKDYVNNSDNHQLASEQYLFSLFVLNARNDCISYLKINQDA